MSLLLFNCCSNNKPYLEIITESDTVGVDETYTAEFQLINYDYSEIWPEHFVIQPGKDTVLFMCDDDNGYGIYNASSSSPGKKEFQGYVVFNHNGKYDTIFFRQEFHVVN